MEKVTPHKHNGTDADRIEFSDLAILAEATISQPSGGATVDTQARAAINSILALLRAKGLMK
jgi:hypothetical protein